MGTGKSTIAKLISSQIEEIYRISLDNREGLKEIYKRRSSFRNFKNFEFVLTGTILSSLKRPHVIDFGAGHSIYENQKLREQMQEMCSEFKNIILLLPSKDKDKSRRILSERRNIKLGSNKDKDNWHFLTAPNNYELVTKIVYEEGKTPEDISREIIQLVKGEVKSKETDEREETQMKISGIDKDFEDIIYYLDAKGYKPFASCDGVEANHERPEEVTDAYISFLKSPKIIDLMAVFLQDKENYTVSLNSGDNERATELYGNIILGMRYGVYFNNKSGENSDKFKSIIKKTVEQKETIPSDEKRKLENLNKVLEESSDSDLEFQVDLNTRYQPFTRKEGKINSLNIETKLREEKIEDNISIKNEVDMEVLANIVSDKYKIPRKIEDIHEEYMDEEFIIPGCDKTSCTIYFKDEHLPQILDQIKYIKEIAHTLPTFESREWIGSDEEYMVEYDKYYDEQYDFEEIEDQLPEEYMGDNFKENIEEKTPLSKREDILLKLEQEAEELLIEEKRIGIFGKTEDVRE